MAYADRPELQNEGQGGSEPSERDYILFIAPESKSRGPSTDRRTHVLPAHSECAQLGTDMFEELMGRQVLGTCESRAQFQIRRVATDLDTFEQVTMRTELSAESHRIRRKFYVLIGHCFALMAAVGTDLDCSVDQD